MQNINGEEWLASSERYHASYEAAIEDVKSGCAMQRKNNENMLVRYLDEASIVLIKELSLDYIKIERTPRVGVYLCSIPR